MGRRHLLFVGNFLGTFLFAVFSSFALKKSEALHSVWAHMRFAYGRCAILTLNDFGIYIEFSSPQMPNHPEKCFPCRFDLDEVVRVWTALPFAIYLYIYIYMEKTIDATHHGPKEGTEQKSLKSIGPTPRWNFKRIYIYIYEMRWQNCRCIYGDGFAPDARNSFEVNRKMCAGKIVSWCFVDYRGLVKV